MYEEKYIGQNYNADQNINGKCLIHKGRSNFKIDSLKRNWKLEKKNINTIGGTHSTQVWFDQCDRIWGQTPKTPGIQGAIDVGD